MTEYLISSQSPLAGFVVEISNFLIEDMIAIQNFIRVVWSPNGDFGSVAIFTFWREHPRVTSIDAYKNL